MNTTGQIMAKTAGVRVSTIKVSPLDIIFPGYDSQYLMQICRSAKQRSELKAVPFGGLDAIYLHMMAAIKRTDFRCECCGGTFERKKDGKGGGADRSLSLHRVIASLGYVPPNIRVLCMACNVAIGETNTYSDIIARVRALRWQAKEMMRVAKKMLANEGLVV